MKTRNRIFGILVLAALALTGCDELARIGDLGNYGSLGTDLIGEVENVDTRAREIELRTDSGRTSVVRYDDRTQVIYQQRNYSVANLEPGDYVAARVQRDRDGRDFADTITVRESVQERGGSRSSGRGNRRLDRAEGTIENIDPRRGTFEMRDSRDHLILVSVPFNAPRSVIDKFNNLRTGDHVRVEGRAVGADHFDLESFL
jgi:exosome complex RNA-binding protein Csl4